MTKAVYPGSFDPMTNGHRDIIARAASVFDEVVVSVMVNVSKKYLFTVPERLNLLSESLKDLPNVRVRAYEGLLIDLVREEKVDVIVKGLRNATDFDYENTMDFYNKRMAPQVESVYLMASHEYVHLSSSAIRELMAFGGDVSGLVPPLVEEALRLR